MLRYASLATGVIGADSVPATRPASRRFAPRIGASVLYALGRVAGITGLAALVIGSHGHGVSTTSLLPGAACLLVLLASCLNAAHRQRLLGPPTAWNRRLILLVGGALLALFYLALLNQLVDRLLPLRGWGMFAFTLAVLALGATAGPIIAAGARATDRAIFRDTSTCDAAVRRLLTSAHPVADPIVAAEAALEQTRRVLRLDWLALVIGRDGVECVVALAASSSEPAPADLATNGRHAAMRLPLDAGSVPAALVVRPKGTGRRLRPSDRELLDVLAALLGGHLARGRLLELLQERNAELEQQRAKPPEATERVRRAPATVPARRPARLPIAKTGAADAARSPRRADAALTEREGEVLALLGGGAFNAAIAGHLSLSIRTVEDVAAHLHRKLGLESRSALVA